nr:hypothetical protein [Tanacetum cinerariifolium]
MKKLKEEHMGSVNGSSILCRRLLSVFSKAAVADATSECIQQSSRRHAGLSLLQITSDIFCDPVITPSGLTYEWAIILDHLEKTETDVSRMRRITSRRITEALLKKRADLKQLCIHARLPAVRNGAIYFPVETLTSEFLMGELEMVELILDDVNMASILGNEKEKGPTGNFVLMLLRLPRVRRRVDNVCCTLCEIISSKHDCDEEHGVILGPYYWSWPSLIKCFALTQERQGEHLLVDRQCILVTASEALVGPKFVEVPTHQGIHSEHISADAEFLAAMLAKSFVPLSVIYRNGLPRMRDIYTAGNNFNQTYGEFAIDFEHPRHLILMSEKFPGIGQALGHLKQKNPDEPLISFKQDFTEEQFDMIFEMLDSKDSAEQPRDGTADVDSSNRQYLPLPEGSTSHFEVGESSGKPVSRKRERKDMA